MLLVHEKAESYAAEVTTAQDDLLHEVIVNTMRDHPHAQMLSGPVQGKLLELFSRMIQPEKILEIGTFTGFSALSLVKGLLENGVLHTIELREEDAQTAAAYFKRSSYEKKIRLHVGNAKEIIPGLNETWDLVFIDADKVSYIQYYELTLPFLRPGGWIIADNVLFHGEVLEDVVKGKNAIAIREFNDHVKADSRVEQVMLTVRDGLLLIRKL